MPSTREQVLSALFDRLQLIAGGTVKRNEALPSSVPAGGLVILRDGDPGEPDVTLNPRSESTATAPRSRRSSPSRSAVVARGRSTHCS